MTEDRPLVKVDRATENDLAHTVICLEGIFWALDMLVCHKAADDVAHEEDRRNGIGALIAAGQLLSREIINRH